MATTIPLGRTRAVAGRTRTRHQDWKGWHAEMGKLVRREQAVPAEDGASDVWGARLRSWHGSTVG